MKMSTAIDEFINSLKPHKARMTWTAYKSDLMRLQTMMGLDTILRFTPELVRRYFEVASADGLKMSTLHRKRACINQFGKWGVKNNLWARNPVDDMAQIRRPKGLPRPFTIAESGRLMALTLSPMQTALRAMLFGSALRVTPLGNLLVAHVNMNPPEVRGVMKGSKEQVVPIPHEVAQIVAAYATAAALKPYDHLFPNPQGGPMHRRTIQRITQEWGRQAGVLNCRPHKFRHTAATELLRATNNLVTVQQFLGHEDVSTTALYTKVLQSEVSAAVQLLPWFKAKA